QYGAHDRGAGPVRRHQAFRHGSRGRAPRHRRLHRAQVLLHRGPRSEKARRTRTVRMNTIRRSNLPLAEMDRGSVFHPMTDLKRYAHGEIAGPRIIESGRGCHIFDRDGNKFLDGFGGLYCVNIGYGRSEVADAIADQARHLAYYHLYAGNSNEPSIRLADRLVRMAPNGMSKVYFGLSGSDANETNVKIVWYYNNVLGRPRKK